MIQQPGSARVGRLFGPVTGLWFAVLALAGLMHVLARPGVLAALDPRYALHMRDMPGVNVCLSPFDIPKQPFRFRARTAKMRMSEFDRCRPELDCHKTTNAVNRHAR